MNNKIEIIHNETIWSNKQDEIVYTIKEWTSHPLGKYEVWITKDGELCEEVLNYHNKQDAIDKINRYEIKL